MKRFMTTLLTAAVLVTGVSATAFGDETEPRVNRRQERQQKRIANGVKSGQLTAGETANLEKKEANLNKEIRTDRKANGGNLTNNEKKQINQQQNKLSKQIYKEKHDGETQQK